MDVTLNYFNKGYVEENIDVKMFLQSKKEKKTTKMSLVALAIKQGATLRDLNNTHADVVLREQRKISQYIDLQNEFKFQDKDKSKYEKMTLFPHQAEAWDLLQKQSERQILWIVDPIGGKGKTELGKWLEAVHNAFYVKNGKLEDIAFAYERQKYVVIDLTRTQEQYVNYAAIECFKDGRILSRKYESKMKRFEPAKLIVFSNWYPNKEALSEDRWMIIEWSTPSFETPVKNDVFVECYNDGFVKEVKTGKFDKFRK